MTTPGYCIDNLEDKLCLQAPVDVLAAACAKNFTTTCKMRARELDGGVAGSFCSTHLNDPFCSCYTAAAPNWTKSCVGYKPKNFLEDPDKRLRDVIEAIKVNQARIAAEVTANAIELDAAKKLADTAEEELRALNVDMDALNEERIKYSSIIDEIFNIRDLLNNTLKLPQIRNANNIKYNFSYNRKPIYTTDPITWVSGPLTPEDIKNYNDLLTEIKNILKVIEDRSNLNLKGAPETQKAINTILDYNIKSLEISYVKIKITSISPVSQAYTYITEARESAMITSRIVDIDIQIQEKRQLRLQAFNRLQDAKNILIPIQTKVDTRAAENATIMAMLNAEKIAAEAANESEIPWLWIIIILLVVIASYVIYKFKRNLPENYVNY